MSLVKSLSLESDDNPMADNYTGTVPDVVTFDDRRFSVDIVDAVDVDNVEDESNDSYGDNQDTIISEELLEKAVKRIKKLGIKLLVLDFDQTFIDCKLTRRFDHNEMVEHIRPAFAALVPALLHADKHVGVATYSKYVSSIKEIMVLCFGDEGNKIIVRGGDSSWNPDDFITEDSSSEGKQLHIAALITDVKEKYGMVISNKEILFVDDDPMVVDIALDNDVRAIVLTPGLSDNQILREIISLRRSLKKKHSLGSVSWSSESELPRSRSAMLLSCLLSRFRCCRGKLAEERSGSPAAETSTVAPDTTRNELFNPEIDTATQNVTDEEEPEMDLNEFQFKKTGDQLELKLRKKVKRRGGDTMFDVFSIDEKSETV